MTSRTWLLRAVVAAALVTAVSGCSYDYRQRTDRVAYSHGDAVRANLARETQNPSKGSAYRTNGLGKDGVVPSTQTVTIASD
jgi:hypothetical protein